MHSRIVVVDVEMRARIAQPSATVTVRSFNHRVGDGEHAGRNLNIERLCDLQVDDELELVRQLDRRIAGYSEFQRWCPKRAPANAVRGTMSGSSSSWRAARTVRGAYRSKPPGYFPSRPSAARRSH